MAKHKLTRLPGGTGKYGCTPSPPAPSEYVDPYTPPTLGGLMTCPICNKRPEPGEPVYPLSPTGPRLHVSCSQSGVGQVLLDLSEQYAVLEKRLRDRENDPFWERIEALAKDVLAAIDAGEQTMIKHTTTVLLHDITIDKLGNATVTVYSDEESVRVPITPEHVRQLQEAIAEKKQLQLTIELVVT